MGRRGVQRQIQQILEQRNVKQVPMNIEERTRNKVNQQLSQLEEKYGEFSVQQETVTNEPDFFEKGRQLAEEGWIGDAGAWVTDDRGRVLLIKHSDAPERWGDTGWGS